MVAGPGAGSSSTNERGPIVIDVGVLSDADRDDAMAAADALAAAVGVRELLAHDDGGVARGDVRDRERRERGEPVALRAVGRRRGLFVGDEFAECLRDVARGASEIDEGAALGRDYVMREYTWPMVLDRVEAAIDEWFPDGAVRMTRAVVVGPYPPTADPLGDVTLTRVRELRAQGYDVVVISPAPSAARRHFRTDTVWGRWRLGRVTRGADLVVVVPADGPAVAGSPRLDLAHRPRARMERWRAGAPTLARTGLRKLRRR